MLRRRRGKDDVAAVCLDVAELAGKQIAQNCDVTAVYLGVAATAGRG